MFFIVSRRTLTLAIELGERAVEAQACYSLGNTYTLLRDFPVAIEYHQRHLTIAQELGDKVGEARACWSLGNAHSSIGNHDKALNFAQQHYGLAKDVRFVSKKKICHFLFLMMKFNKNNLIRIAR